LLAATMKHMLALLALALLVAQAARAHLSRRATSSSPWTEECGAPPDETSGPQHICTSYRSRHFNTDRLWIRGFMSAPEKENQGCYIFLYGSQNDFTPGKAHEPQLWAPFFTREMAKEGYCAVQVDYARPTVFQFFWLPSEIRRKVEDVFGSHGSSALSVVNRIPGCDCSKRTVVHGHSQGAMIVSIAGVYSPWVEKILSFSGGCQAGIINVCPEINRHRQLGQHSDGNVSSDARPQIRVVGSQNDGTLGCGFLDPAPKAVAQFQTMTGRVCEGSTGCSGDVTTNCLDSAGTGYVVIPEAEKPARFWDTHNWFMQMDPLNETNEALVAWSATYNVERILHGNGWSWFGFDSGHEEAQAMNEAFTTSDKVWGWPASKQYLLS